MDACTKNIVCLGDFCSCGDILLNIPGLVLGEYRVVALFNGVKIRQYVTVTEVGKAMIENVFNEDYVHYIYFIDENDDIVNDTWYSITIKPCVDYAI